METSHKTHTHNCFGHLTGTTQVSRYQKKHSPTQPTHTFPAHQPSFISFLYLPQSIASSLLKLCAWQSFRTTSNHVLFGLRLGLEPSTSYPYMSSPNHYPPFAIHVYTIITCFAVVPTLCPLFLVSLSTPYLKLNL